jgi:hypothetical protein
MTGSETWFRMGIGYQNCALESTSCGRCRTRIPGANVFLPGVCNPHQGSTRTETNLWVVGDFGPDISFYRCSMCCKWASLLSLFLHWHTNPL